MVLNSLYDIITRFFVKNAFTGARTRNRSQQSQRRWIRWIAETRRASGPQWPGSDGFEVPIPSIFGLCN